MDITKIENENKTLAGKTTRNELGHSDYWHSPLGSAWLMWLHFPCPGKGLFWILGDMLSKESILLSIRAHKWHRSASQLSIAWPAAPMWYSHRKSGRYHLGKGGFTGLGGLGLIKFYFWSSWNSWEGVILRFDRGLVSRWNRGLVPWVD